MSAPIVKPYEEALPLNNRQVAARLDEIADLLEIQNANPFRVRAYRTAAATVRELNEPARAILEREGLPGLIRLPGIGEILARAIERLTFTGRLPFLDQLQAEMEPESLLASVPGIGPELAVRIRQQLGIHNLEELEMAAHENRLAEVPGLGPKRLRAIRDSLAGRLRWRNWPSPAQARRTLTDPPVSELLELDREYRTQAEAGRLTQIAPRRFNPTGEAWLPVYRTRRGSRRYQILYSNTALAHRLGTTRDWVVIYCKDELGERQWTIVTARSGRLRGRRVVRGREAECADYYAQHPEGTAEPATQA